MLGVTLCGLAKKKKKSRRERDGKNFRTLEKCSDSPDRHFAMSWTLISNWKQSTPLHKGRNSTSDNTNTHTHMQTQRHTYICIYDHFHDWPTWTHNFNGHMYVVCCVCRRGNMYVGEDAALRGRCMCGHNIWPCPGFHSECVWWINDAAWNFQWFALVSLCFAFSHWPRSR